MKGLKWIAAVCAAAMLTGAVGVSASAAQIDSDETIQAVGTEAGDESALPAVYSSVERGYVTSVKSQTGNNCWVHATLGTLESKLLRMGVSDVDMNTNHLDLWATTRAGDKGWLRSQTDSAYCCTGPGYLASWQGGVLLSDAVELPTGNAVTGDMVPTDRIRWGVTAMRYLNEESREVIKRAIMDNGGVTAGYAQNGAYMNNNVSYYMPPSYAGSRNGHMIELVGWNDNYDKSNFTVQPKENGAWLMKNSWGTGNVQNGYYWISYEDKYLFSTNYKPAVAIESVEEVTDRKKLVQNEIYGATYEFDYIEDSELTFLNRLHFDDEHFLLDKVIFETRLSHAAYSLYYVPDVNGAPTADEAAWTPLGSGVTDYAGYICADIDNFELPDAVGSVAVRLNAGDGTAAIGVGEWLTDSHNRFVFRNESEYGMSYLFRNGRMQDLLQWYQQENNDEIGATFVIKALTLKPEDGDVDLNNKVNIEDATLVQKLLVELEALSDRQLVLADANMDGKVDISDVTYIQMMIAGYFD